MLSYMRRNAGSWIIKVVFVLIALTFIGGFGILPQLRKWEERGNVIAEVGQRRITRMELDQAYQRILQAYRQMYKEAVTDEMLKQLRLKENALNSLINSALQLEEARKLGIDVTEEEVQAWIQAMPYFQRDGRFSKDLYLRLLKANRVEPGEFEAEQRDQLVLRKVGQLVHDTVKISDQELWHMYRMDKEKMRLSFLAFDPRQYEDRVEPSEQRLKDYFQKHAASYTTPEKRKIVCAVFSPEDYQEDVQVQTGDIEEYYDSHIDQYSRPEEVRLRHILLKADPGQQRELFEQKRATLAGLLERARKGEDFSQLARHYSEDTTAKDGGSLGYVRRGDLAPEVEAAAFSLKPGDVSDIVVSQHGLHILKVEDHRNARVDSLETVKPLIADALKKEKARVLARRKAEEYLWSLKEKGGGPLVQDEGSSKPRVKETDFFSRGEPVPGIGVDQALTNAAFSLGLQDVSEVIKGDRAFYVLKVMEKKDPGVPQYDEVAEAVRRDVVKEESTLLARNAAEEALALLRQGKELAAVGQKAGLRASETEWFNRLTSYISPLGGSQELKEIAFTLTEKDPLPEAPIETGGKYYVLKFKERAEPSKEEFDLRKDTFRETQEQKKREEVYRAWLEGLRAGVEIKISAKEL